MCACASLPTFHLLTVTMQLFQPRHDGVSEGHGVNYFPSLFWSSESRPRTPHYSDNLIIVSLTEAVTGLLMIMIASSRTKRATTIPSADLVYGPVRSQRDLF